MTAIRHFRLMTAALPSVQFFSEDRGFLRGTSFWILDLMVHVHLLSVIVYDNDKTVRALISNER
jgi:hypothetical protein